MRHCPAILVLLVLALLLNLLVAVSCALAVRHDRLVDRAPSTAIGDRFARVWSDRRPSDFPARWTGAEPRDSRGLGYAVLYGHTGDPDIDHSLAWVRTGWPCKSFEGERWKTTTLAPDRSLPGAPLMITGNFSVEHDLALVGSNRWPRTMYDSPALVPFGPIWTGLVINTLCYAGLLGLLLAVLARARRRRRLRRGRCPRCGYPFGDSSRCPECGTVIIPAAT